MAKLHRGKGCPLCGKTTPHFTDIKRTGPGGNTIRHAFCRPKGGKLVEWLADGYENRKPSNAPTIRHLIALGWAAPRIAS